MPARTKWCRVAACVALAVAGGISGPVRADAPDSLPVTTEPPRGLVFNPAPPSRTRAFFITEFSTNFLVGVGSQDNVDHFLFTDAFGLMVNTSPRDAVGGSVDLHLAFGHPKGAPTLRYRRWFDRQSLEVSLGYVPGDTPGVIGPIASVRYSPSPLVYFQAGGCRLRETPSIVYYPVYERHDIDENRVFLGVGVGGIAGVAFWGAQLVAGVVVVAMVAGMD